MLKVKNKNLKWSDINMAEIKLEKLLCKSRPV